MKKRLLAMAGALLAAGLALSLEFALLSPRSGAAQAFWIFRYVAPTLAQCGSNKPCYTSIQAAIDAAGPGDHILVAQGTYTGVFTRGGSAQLIYLDKDITLRGGYETVLWTVGPGSSLSLLDAQGQGRVLTIAGGSTIGPVVEGFRMINGKAGNGGAVSIHQAAATVQYNEIFSSTAEGYGGGVYVLESAAHLFNNHVAWNRTGPSGRGGGIALESSPAEVRDNNIAGNRAHVGGGVQVSAYRVGQEATLSGNRIEDNLALDVVQDGITFDGAGGGINLDGDRPHSVRENTVRHNHGKWGGGLHAFGNPSVIEGNRFEANTAPIHGGGVYVQGGPPVIRRNEFIANTAENWGGGLCLIVNSGTVSGNLFEGNHSDWRGGGVYISGSAAFDGNRFVANTAVYDGGGLFNVYGSPEFTNNVWMENSAPEGSAIYNWGSDGRYSHSTLVDNHGASGRAVFIDTIPGVVDPGGDFVRASNVHFTNTLVATQTVAIYATAANTVTLDGVLWHNVAAHIQAAGASLSVVREWTGDPLFQPDGYHLRAYSAARDKVDSPVDHDLDGHLRDWGPQKDLGADEFIPPARIEPDTGGELTRASAGDGVTITVKVPPNSVTQTTGLEIVVFPPPPPDVLNSPFGMFIPFSPPFRLDPFTIQQPLAVTEVVDLPVVAYWTDEMIYDYYPAELIVELGIEKVREMRYRLDQLELVLMRSLGIPSALEPGPGAPVTVDESEGQVTFELDDTGAIADNGLFRPVIPLRPAASRLEPYGGYYMLVVRVHPLYLPVVIR